MSVDAAADAGPAALAAYAELGLTLTFIDSDSSEPAEPVYPKVGSTALVHYTGTLTSGKEFDSTKGAPLAVRVGRGAVIGGWDVVLPHLPLGRKARIVVPPVLAYGAKGKPPVIPPNSTLTFELQVVEVVDTPEDRLLDAASTGDTIKLMRARSDGADVAHTDRKGQTALHAAAAAGAAECVVRLIEAGARVDAIATQPSGVTPLMLAVRSGDVLASAALLNARADPSHKSAKGNSALSLASEPGAPPEMASLLRGASASGEDGATGEAIDEDDALGIGWDGARPGWEAIRCRALHRSRVTEANPRCWLRLSAAALDAPAASSSSPPWDSSPAVVVELFADVVPLTAENFRCLCTGEKGKASAFGSPPLHYKGNVSHRIVPGQILQAGDITSGDGKGGESIYGPKFADESFAGAAGRHHIKGLLSMANSGRNTNGSQFFITLSPMRHLDGKHVVFGRVVSGMEYVELVSAAGGSPSGVPTRRVTIVDCGQL